MRYQPETKHREEVGDKDLHTVLFGSRKRDTSKTITVKNFSTIPSDAKLGYFVGYLDGNIQHGTSSLYSSAADAEMNFYNNTAYTICNIGFWMKFSNLYAQPIFKRGSVFQLHINSYQGLTIEVWHQDPTTSTKVSASLSYSLSINKWYYISCVGNLIDGVTLGIHDMSTTNNYKASVKLAGRDSVLLGMWSINRNYSPDYYLTGKSICQVRYMQSDKDTIEGYKNFMPSSNFKDGFRMPCSETNQFYYNVPETPTAQGAYIATDSFPPIGQTAYTQPVKNLF